MAHFGVHIPRVSADQGRSGKAVGRDGMRPGDLVFWDNSSRNVGADHVGIYIGNGLYIAAPRPGGAVEIGHLYGDYWARRVL
jgi:cell wall-associated NlpC family hydrolase